MRTRATVRLACAAGLVAMTFGLGAPAQAASGTVPFTDPASDGFIGFCDLAGHQVTSGSVSTAPFVWKAVSSVAAPKGYRGKGQNTALFIYQAQQDIPPGDWSGDSLTSDSLYKSAREPTAAATYKDFPLKVILTEFPPKWHGLYQLRMQFGKANYGVYSATYPTAVIQVTGNTWRVVSGGAVNCAKATAVSQETVSAGIPTRPKKPVKGETAPTASASAQATSAGAASARPAAASSSARPAPSGTDPSSDQATGSSHGGGMSGLLIVVLIVAGLVAAGLVGAALGRRHSSARP